MRPLDSRDDGANNIQPAKNSLVVASEPLRKIDIEVGFSVRGVPGRDGRERATPGVEQQHDDFDDHHRSKPRRSAKVAERGSNGNGKDASSEERPDRGVDKFYRP